MMPWLAEAAAMPLAFAQVREDPRVDLAAIESLDARPLEGIMIASGGCTAAVLAASGRFASLELVDINPAQLALTKLKLHLLQHATPAVRLALLGHAAMPDRGVVLQEMLRSLQLPDDIFGPAERIAELGPDHAGRYELLFAELQRQLRASIDWPAILAKPNPAAAVMEKPEAGRAFDAAFDRVMALDNLVALFGSEATQNSVMPFSRHFASQTRAALHRDDAADNPFLWQLLAGIFPAATPYDWFSLAPPTTMPQLHCTQGPMSIALDGPADRFDFVHLSNILDWLSASEAQRVLRQAFAAMRSGGIVLIRQLNSSLDFATLSREFEWQSDIGDQLHASDRSFFYRRMHVGRKR